MDWRDRTIGIVLGVVLGVGVVVAFVFFLSEQTVDAPSLSIGQAPVGAKPHGHPQPQRPQKRSKESPQPAPAPVATVRIVGGAPPPGGPAELYYARWDVIRLNVVSDATLEVELTGYGLTRTVPANQPTEIDVEASRSGTFALIVADSHIDVARITVGGGSP
ncbi:MAG TPA: hypothetical protein VKA47_06310 [Solirubrobacterales bacterium]|nr:hypothetical protein [Solirubrobacterales bacterium]